MSAVEIAAEPKEVFLKFFYLTTP